MLKLLQLKIKHSEYSVNTSVLPALVPFCSKRADNQYMLQMYTRGQMKQNQEEGGVLFSLLFV